MRAVVQRVRRARVIVGDEVVGEIGAGLLVYVAVSRHDNESDVDYLARKVRHLRVFTDEAGKMNLDVVEGGGAVLVVSNFSLLGDARKGRRPAYSEAADPDTAAGFYHRLCEKLRTLGLTVETGRFREMMSVEATNDGPINVLLDSGRSL